MKDSLISLGLSTFFIQQLSADEVETAQIARVIEVQRSHIVTSNGAIEWKITLGGAWYRVAAELRPTVGDWVILDDIHSKIIRLLERKSVFKRIAAGNKPGVQLIASNVDTLFIVTSCNEEFNESRLERYLALAFEAQVDPVIVLTKADLTNQQEEFQERVELMGVSVPIEVINAKDLSTFDNLNRWITDGSTIALVGSSGVGKSTILNTLSESEDAQTGQIRQADAKGRHTTSFRSLHRLPGGGILMDVPGIRELKVAELDNSLDDVFEDVESYASKCKFSNCSHTTEPGCAVQQAIKEGDLDSRRLTNYQKLIEEELRNSASLAVQRNRDRQFSKSVRQHQALKNAKTKKKPKLKNQQNSQIHHHYKKTQRRSGFSRDITKTVTSH